MATLKVTGCRVDTNSITISFSEAVDTNPLSAGDSASALDLANYTIFAPNSGFNNSPLPSTWTASALPDGRTVELIAPASPTPTFSPGDWVQITVTAPGIGLAGTTGAPVLTSGSVSSRVPSEAARETRDVEDAISYPILTEEIGYRSSPVGSPTGGGGSIAGGGGSNLGQVALRTVGDVLGWKPNAADPKGFIGALTQAFTLTDVEGHVESKWMPRTYAVQTDLGGGITGAQASLYTRAKDALDQSLSLLDGLYPLDPEADPEYVKALREMARSQMTEIVKELGTVGLPSILRIDTYFEILLGQHPTRHFTQVQFDPDKIKGTLGELRDTYGIKFRGNRFNNSVEDEQDITNFRVISDYMTSLMQSWIANREFFEVRPNKLAFFGTQLVLISRQLNVIAETVNEVRFALDSVFIGPNERQALLLEFRDHSLPPMFLEDVLDEIEKFVTDEGPQLLRDGGKISVTNNILPVVRSLQHLVKEAHDPENKKKVPDGFRTVRVRRSLDDLQHQLGELIRLTEQVEQQVPLAEDELSISGVLATSTSDGENDFITGISFYGTAIDPQASVILHSTTAVPTSAYTVVFYSAERIDVAFVDHASATTPPLEDGSHEVTVTNPDGESATLRFTYYWNTGSPTAAPRNSGSSGGSVVNGAATNPTARPAGKTRQVIKTLGDEGGFATVSSSATAAPAPAAGAEATPAPAPAPAPAAGPAPAPPAAAAPAPAPVAAAPAPAAAAAPASVDDIAGLHDRIDEVQKKHETLFQRLEDKMSDFFEGKSKDKKSKD